jgi:hypothetical protein
MRFTLVTLHLCALILFGFSTAHAAVDNRYCQVTNGTDDVNSFGSLRRKLTEGFNRTRHPRACTEKIEFDPNQGSGSYLIELDSPLSINNSSDLDQDGDGFGLVIDGSRTLHVEINGEGMGENCVLTVNASKVRLNGFTLAVDKLRKAICVSPESTDVDFSGVQILAKDDPDRDRIPNDEDNCPDKSNPDQKNDDSDGFGNACDKCPLADDPGQEDTDDDGIGDACEEPPPSPTPSASPSPSPSPTPSPTPQPTATPVPTPTGTPTPTATPAPSETPNPTPIIDIPPKDPKDVDGDGKPNDADNCPTIANTEQKDDDNDGRGNECDPSPSGSTGTDEGFPIVDLNDSGAAAACSLMQAGPAGGLAFALLFLLPTAVNWFLRRRR